MFTNWIYKFKVRNSHTSLFTYYFLWNSVILIWRPLFCAKYGNFEKNKITVTNENTAATVSVMMRTISHCLKYVHYKINGKMLGFECRYFSFIHISIYLTNTELNIKCNEIYKLTVFDSIHELLPICYKPMKFHVTECINTSVWSFNMTSTYKSLDTIQIWDITFILFHLYPLTKHKLIRIYNDKFHWKLT